METYASEFRGKGRNIIKKKGIALLLSCTSNSY